MPAGTRPWPMRRHWLGIVSVWAAMFAGLSAAQPVAAEESAGATGPAVADNAMADPSVADPCATKSGVLGVSRVIEVDATNGPRFGLGQYKENDILADKEVVLTFDDGPLRRFTRPVLDALDAECTKATFFVVGRMALADPATLIDMAKRGHTIGTHTWSHKNLQQTGAAKAKTEIELGISAITLALGQPVAPFFRFPYLGDTRAMRQHLEQRHQSAFGIDVDSRDFTTKQPATVIRNVMSQLATKGKGIILFHDIQPSTASAVTQMLSKLRSEGYKVVHMVAKAPATTLPEYDAMAAKEAARRRIAKAGDPLADRSVVWPVKPAAGGDELPWLKPTAIEAAVEPASATVPAAVEAEPAPASETVRSRGPAKPRVTEPPPLRNKTVVEDDSSWATSPLSIP